MSPSATRSSTGRPAMKLLLLLALPTVPIILLAGSCKNKNDDTSSSTAGPQVPIANAGSDQSVSVDNFVVLDGHGSYDPDGDALTYYWNVDHVPEGAAAPVLLRNDSAESVTTQFRADTVGVYTLSLVVSDGKNRSASDFVVVTVTEPVVLPVANAGPDQVVKMGRALASLDGSASYDPLGRALTFSWSLVDYPEHSAVTSASIDNASETLASFTPDVKGVYVANLIVNNGVADSIADATVITVTSDNGPPTANAGEDQNIEDCAFIMLDCTRSVDPDGDPLAYNWSLQEKPVGSASSNDSFGDRTAGNTTFWADVSGVYVFSCSVNDSEGWVTPDLLNVNVLERKANNPPSVEAGIPRDDLDAGTAACELDGYGYECDECASLIIPLGHTAAVEDLDSDPFTTLWTVVDGEASILDPLSLVTSATLSEATPTGPGECTQTAYTFQLAATDCPGATVTDTVTYLVQCCGIKEKTKKKKKSPAEIGSPGAPPSAPTVGKPTSPVGAVK